MEKDDLSNASLSGRTKEKHTSLIADSSADVVVN